MLCRGCSRALYYNFLFLEDINSTLNISKDPSDVLDDDKLVFIDVDYISSFI